MLDIDTPDAWWRRTGCQMSEKHYKGIVRLARWLLVITPHTADPVRAFSYLGQVHNPIANRFKVSTTGAMAEIKAWLQIWPTDDLQVLSSCTVNTALHVAGFPTSCDCHIVAQ